MADRAVCFRDEDYAGKNTRFAIILIDGFVLFFALILWLVVAVLAGDGDAGSRLLIELGSPALVAAYLGTFHSFGLRTIGYRLMGCRLVDYEGKRPSFWRATSRGVWLTFMFPLVFHDLTRVHRTHVGQSIVDRMVGTVVVRAKAEPVGEGAIAWKIECADTAMLATSEVPPVDIR